MEEQKLKKPNKLPPITELEKQAKISEGPRRRTSSEGDRIARQKMVFAYQKFLNECMPVDLYDKVIEANKRGKFRINLRTFVLNDRVHADITYCSLLQGSHKTRLPHALKNIWVRNFRDSNFEPVLETLKKNLGITENSGYKITCYKYRYKQVRWAIELEWCNDPNHDQKVKEYNEWFGPPF